MKHLKNISTINPKIYRTTCFSLFTFVILSLFACKDTQDDPTKDIIFPDDNVSFSNHVGPLFQQKCASALCHSGPNAEAGLNLEYPSYQALMKQAGLVVPHDGTHSTLIQHLEGALSLMPPPEFPQLTQNQKKGVKKWIDEGAQNN
jgi:uncharacterized membrane protein